MDILTAKKLPRISVITPSLNQGRFLRRTLESVLSQDYPDLELIVMDGGSTDESVSILREYDSQLTYWVSQPDGGQPQALNLGLSRATGQVIAYLNSDDWYAPGSLLLVGRLFAEMQDELDWIVGQCLYQGQGQSELRQSRIPEDPARWVGEGVWLPQASSFWTRRAFDLVGYFRTDMQYVFDTEFAIRLLFAGLRPMSVPKVLAHRWLHEDCKTVANSKRFLTEQQRFLDLFRSRLTLKQARTANVLRCRARLNGSLLQRHWPTISRNFIDLCLLSPRSAASFMLSCLQKELG